MYIDNFEKVKKYLSEMAKVTFFFRYFLNTREIITYIVGPVPMKLCCLMGLQGKWYTYAYR